MSRNIKIIVVSSKGGVGKSTVAIQLITPFLYEKTQERVFYYECDDENRDYLSYGASRLIHRKVIEVDSPLLHEDVFEMLSQDHSLCVDIGGNKSTKILLDALSLSGAIEYVDLAVIPLLDGEQDAINALSIYRDLKEIKSDIKVVFVLNRVRELKYLPYQFDNFFGDSRGIFTTLDSVVKHLEPQDQSHYISLLEDEVIKYSRRFGLTVYEIAEIKRDFLAEIRDADPKEAKILSFKRLMDKNSKRYSKEVLLPAFTSLEKLLEEKM